MKIQPLCGAVFFQPRLSLQGKEMKTGSAKMRKPFIAGNWKMFLNKKTAVELAGDLVDGSKDVEGRDVLVCPAHPLLGNVSRAIAGSPLFLGAQNMYHEKEGAFTGETSADMLLSLGCTYVILGHSERRHVFHEDNDTINKKLRFALESGLKPILCVGEVLEERETDSTESVVNQQVRKGLNGIGITDLTDIIIAYEPVWAIGTGKTATPEDADAVHSYIRATVADLYDKNSAEALRILYGGSVKPENIDGLMAKDNLDGVLVGGASLKADSFLRIIKYES
jgi:triosephosphate isomerase